tara:strand:+ start:1524 stop:1793 length:270 start_codon:yes stop_codon:yes gene_type:complete
MIEKGLENKVVTKSSFTYGNLARAFDELTKGMENWKDPISTKVRTREIRLYERACEFYTGSKLISGEVDESIWGRTEVHAAGYYAAVEA